MGITLLIDNYDSFTWNVYADIAVLGGNPVVVRNDKITLEQIEEMYNSGELERIVISPGPGHPRTDSGISRDAISWGIGKLPILGVCMGLECIVDLLGGEIAYAGEIKHGKSSLIQHDSIGIFHDLPPLLSSVRYHSLSAQLLSLPPILQVSSTTQESGVIMGVRHREATVEAVQYHPESCKSEGGKGLMANFLKLKGGKWGGENAWCGVVPTIPGEDEQSSTIPNGSAQSSASGSSRSAPSLPTILNKIHAQRLLDVEETSKVLATTPANITKSLSLHTSPPLISFVDRIKSTPHTAIMAEIKRASPSKGDIAPDASAPSQALRYALAGASVISVLTEPKWFKGSLIDMLSVRNALDSLPNRPAILRKDFILSKYMIDEARLYGADTVLLIVAMLEPTQLKELYDYSVSIGMEPLVEVNNTKELELALQIGSKVIGVNNRNLHDFNVDMSTTSRVNAALDGRDVILCALSGISSPEDVQKYVKEGVKAVLVGESLMRAKDTGKFLRSLIGLPLEDGKRTEEKPLVKICGIRSVEDAGIAINAGADLLGLILVPNAKRRISLEVARDISDLVKATRSKSNSSRTNSKQSTSTGNEPWFTFNFNRLTQRKKPLLVGVFQNQPLAEILDAVDEIGLDIVQLHGDESQQLAKFIPVPVIKVFKISTSPSLTGEVVVSGRGEISRPGLNQFVLLDSAGKGGEGISFPWENARKVIEKGENGSEGSVKLPIILAGGLDPTNVRKAIEVAGGSEGVRMVDVSSGVERDGGDGKDRSKVEEFVRAVKGQI
ncbi:multifunctional tryptophan biosynthesis protein [Kwoniella sp. B9012]